MRDRKPGGQGPELAALDRRRLAAPAATGRLAISVDGGAFIDGLIVHHASEVVDFPSLLRFKPKKLRAERMLEMGAMKEVLNK